MADIFTRLTLVCYGLATLSYLLLLVSREQRALVGRIASWATILGFAAHTTALIGVAHRYGQIPFYSARASFSFFVWAMVLVYLIVEAKYKIEIFGSFVLPLVLLGSIYAVHLPQGIQPLISHNKRLFLTVHVSLAFIGFATFSFTVCAGVMYLIQDRQLKSKHPGRFYHKLPSLEVLDSLSYKSICIGFPFLTVAVILGLLWALSTRTSIMDWRFREVWWFFIWLAYAVLLQARVTVGWRGRRAAYVAIGVFILACIPLLIS